MIEASAIEANTLISTGEDPLSLDIDNNTRNYFRGG